MLKLDENELKMDFMCKHFLHFIVSFMRYSQSSDSYYNLFLYTHTHTHTHTYVQGNYFFMIELFFGESGIRLLKKLRNNVLSVLNCGMNTWNRTSNGLKNFQLLLYFYRNKFSFR